MIGTQVGNQLLVMLRGLVGTVVGAFRQVPETSLAPLSKPLDPFEDRRAGGVEGPGVLRDVLSVSKEEIDHRPAVGLGVLRVSQRI